MLLALLAGAGLGLLSVPHCAAMCGPLSVAVCARSGQVTAPLHYQAGRVAGYAFVGALSGHLGRAVASVNVAAWSPLLLALATGAALLLLARRLWNSTQPARPTLITLRTTAPSVSWWARLQSLLPEHAAVFGLATALLPCGALAAALLASVQYAEPQRSALSMVGFAIASAPGTLAVGWLLTHLPLLRSPRVLRGASLLLVTVAALLIARPIVRFASQPTLPDEVASCH